MQAVDPCSSGATTSNTASLTSRGTTGIVSTPQLVPGGNASRPQPSGGSSKSPPVPAAVVPLPDRVALLTLPEMAMKNKGRIRPEEVWDALAESFSPLEEKFCQIQYVRQDRFRVWCTSAEVLEEVVSTGVVLRGHPVLIRPYQSRSWVTITHLPFGLVEADIAQALAPYGKVHEVKFVSFRKVRTGTVKVRMDISTSIPTRLRVCGHAGLVFHQGQARTCFNCGVLGHESKKCPQKAERRGVPKTPEDASTEPKTPKVKRKRKRRRRAPLPNPEGGPSGSAGSGEDRPPPKRAGAPPLPATTGPEGENPPAPPSTQGAVENTTPPPPPTDPSAENRHEMEISQEPSCGVSEIDYILIRDSVEAAAKAPPIPSLDKVASRHSKAPHFRWVKDSYVYVEEGEMVYPDHPFPALQATLRERGNEIRAIMKTNAGPNVRYKIRDHCVVIVRPDREPVEVPLTKWRSTIIDEFSKWS